MTKKLKLKLLGFTKGSGALDRACYIANLFKKMPKYGRTICSEGMKGSSKRWASKLRLEVLINAGVIIKKWYLNIKAKMALLSTWKKCLSTKKLNIKKINWVVNSLKKIIKIKL